MLLMPDRVASMVSSIGGENFGRAVLGMLDPDLDIGHCAAFERVSVDKAPRVFMVAGLTDEGNAASLDLAKQWVDTSDYRVDPILEDIEEHARQATVDVYYVDRPSAPGCVGLQARMVEQYYDPLNAGEEATYTYREGERLLSLSLYKRRGSARFSAAQRESLSGLSSLLLNSAGRHAQLLPAQVHAGTEPEWAQTRADKLARLRAALLMDASHLTLREAEICACIVMGYTGFAISLQLGISPNTVSTHRKRAYSKLNISSQTELFSICLRYCV